MAKKLLIVESPAKAKTIGKYLGGDFVVKSSIGHIRDLPPKNSAIKIEEKGENKWTFDPAYVVSEGKEKVVKELKTAVKEVDEIYLASDPDREGEAIAWHLHEVLSPVAGNKPFYRVTYNEITKKAVLDAVAHPREVNLAIVDAQQARRILDRLVGYQVSPLLWRSIPCPNPKTLSAGRVQSVALRLLVERKREMDAFVPEVYFLMGVETKKQSQSTTFIAKLSKLDEKKPEITTRQMADNILLDLAGASLKVANLKEQPKKRHPMPPFTTSTLQQAASSFLSMSPGKTMKLAQSLYEQGLITYMRTDSVNVSDLARDDARKFIVENFGQSYYPETPNFYKSKADAQVAHEAIRPTDVALSPKHAKLEASELKLYDLIWRRFVASQMADAQTTVKTVSLHVHKESLAHAYIFTASATEINFDGYLKVMKATQKKKSASDEEEDTDEVDHLPELAIGEELPVVRWLADEKKTKGPTCYSEASLIKALEENGVGRPSTYAAIIEKLKSHGYAENDKRKLVPVDRGILVWDWLGKKLDSLFNVGYTAEMESELDKIETCEVSMNAMLSDFYAKFLKDVALCADPPPDPKHMAFVFSLLDEVKEWKPAKKVGSKVYDDKAFVDSVKDRIAKGKGPTARQLEFLVRMVSLYADQIENAEMRLKEAGIGAGSSMVMQKADDEMVAYCFATMERIGGMLKNPFLKSIYDQFKRGRSLSLKQFAVLARAIGDNASQLEDCDVVREKLSPYVPGGFKTSPQDEVVLKIFELLKTVTEWRPVARRGKKLYDDKAFVKSLEDQFGRRQSLSPRQTLALRRVALLYREKIPTFEQHAEELGLTDISVGLAKYAESEEAESKAAAEAGEAKA